MCLLVTTPILSILLTTINEWIEFIPKHQSNVLKGCFDNYATYVDSKIFLRHNPRYLSNLAVV